MSDSPFADLRGLPYYDDEPTLHMNLGGRLWGWEFDGWKPESMSWKTGCYIHTGLSNTQTNFTGPDVKEFFSSIAVNGFETFEIGSMKHSIRRARVPLLRGPAVAALQARDVEGLRRADDADAELPHPGRGTDVAGDARARDG
jgi:hypothetical protein